MPVGSRRALVPVLLTCALSGCGSTDRGSSTPGAGGSASATGGAAPVAGGMPGSGGAPGGGAGATGSATGGVATGGAAPVGSGGATVAAGGAGSGGQVAAGPGCAGHTYAFCEDFESAADGALPDGWTRVEGWNQGAAIVTSAEHHGGQRALASAVAVNGQPRAGHSLTSLGALAGTHWGRVFYKVKTPFPLPKGGVIHNTLVGLRGSSESRVVDTVVDGSGAHQFLYNLPDDSCCGGSSYDYHSYDGQWHCAEWHIDAVTQSFHFYFEGAEISAIGFDDHAESGARIEQFSSIAVGWINYQSPEPPYYESWFDDLAIDGARVGCQ